MYKPETNFELYLGRFIRGFLPYLSQYTYVFTAERARVAGMRVEDSYEQKFFREPYVAWHIYAQYFHPTTLLERVRNINVYRKHNVIFKGFSLPDWAQSKDTEGFDTDIYSRKIWDQAWHEFKSEQTPAQFNVQSLEPNLINLARWEHWGKGLSSRFFYNEVPKPMWFRNGGRLEDPEKHLFSFTHGDQGSEDLFGFDTSTPEGQKFLLNEIKYWKQVTPEMMKNVPEEIEAFDVKPQISSEPHFQRSWNHYRKFQFNFRINHLIESGDLEKDDLLKA